MCVDENGMQHEFSVPLPLVRKDLIAQMHADAREIMPEVMLDCVMTIPQPFITPIYDFTAPRSSSAALPWSAMPPPRSPARFWRCQGRRRCGGAGAGLARP